MATIATSKAAAQGRLPVRSRDRRPALAALALLLIVGGGLGAALIVYRSGQRTDVLVASKEIKPGQRVTSDDFSTARVSSDSGGYVHASSKRAFVGSYAVSDIPVGTIVNNKMFQVGSVIPTGGEVVGLDLAIDQRPATAPAVGDVVRVYEVSKAATTNSQPVAGPTLAAAARVVAVHSSSSDATGLTVSVLLPTDEAGKVVDDAAIDTVAISFLPRNTKPTIDFATHK